MAKFILRRLLLAVPVVFGISVITFLLLYFLPADPARMYAGPNATVETVNRIRHQMGLDEPVWVQYERYLARAVQGDFGYSYRLQMPVSQAIASRFPYTLELTLAGIFVELLIGLVSGVAAAVKRNTWVDSLSMLVALLGVAAPPFWLGLVFLYLFAYKLSLFPLGGAGGISHLILPAITAGLGGAAWYARMARSSTIDIMRADYVRTAKAKGLPGWIVLGKHVMRNALNPIITMAGMDIPWFVSGVVLVEIVYGWPGVGRLAVDAVQTDDIPMVMGTVIFTALLVVISSVVIDVAQALLDPRVRMSD
ncbi:MAG: ABC transporter permease [Symbiobacteriia bacterium]